MTLRGKFNAGVLAAVFGGILAAGVGLFLHTFKAGSGLANSSYQLSIVARGEQAIDEAVIVYLDEQSFLNLGQPQNAPWDRSLHARLIQRLSAAGAKAIVFDIVFSDPNPANPAADEALANAMKESGRVVLAADRILAGIKLAKNVPPFPLVRDSVADRFGSAEVTPDADLVVRQHTPERELPALSWTAAEFVGAKATRDDAVRNRPKWVNYYGPANFIPSASYYQALDPAAVPDSFFSNRTVFVGARIITKSAGERKDEYLNPFGSWSSVKMAEDRGSLFISGVEIQATMFLNLLRGDWLRRFPTAVEQTIVIGFGLIIGFVLTRFKPLGAVIAALASIVIVALVFYAIFRQLTWFPWLLLIVQIAVAIAWSILFNSIQLYVQRRLYEQTLSLYLSPKLVRKFSGNPNLLKPGAEKQVLTFFFSDIENFTTMSEDMDSDELAEMMNHYFGAAVAGCIHATDGTVVKYIGDAIFAFWNAPESQEDHAMRACEAALAFRERGVHEYNGRQIRTRIGLHTGEANVGNFGSIERVDYTALGASVNLASRVEGMNKQMGTQLLMTGATRASLGDRVLTRELGLFRLKGLEKPIVIYELLGRPGEAESTRAWREAFAVALEHYKIGELQLAEPAFHRVLELRPDDGPTHFYLARIRSFTGSSGGTWGAEMELKEK